MYVYMLEQEVSSQLPFNLSLIDHLVPEFRFSESWYFSKAFAQLIDDGDHSTRCGCAFGLTSSSSINVIAYQPKGAAQ